MAKAQKGDNAEKQKKPEEPETITLREHNRTILWDRFLSWFTIARNRSIKEGDPAPLIDAADYGKALAARGLNEVKKEADEEEKKEREEKKEDGNPEAAPVQD